MANSVIVEGKTTNEAIEKGLKQLNVSKNMVDVRVIENEDKKSFFSILTPRVVKVELTVKENPVKVEKKENEHNEKKEIIITEEDLQKAKQNLEEFLETFMETIGEETTNKSVKIQGSSIEVEIDGKNIGFLIGYRGETLYAFQTILSSVANKNTENRVRVILDIAGYKEKRIKTLENLADRLAKTVMKTRKSMALEPMPPYERKIIHSRLQDNNKIITHSVGEEPHRKVVISLNK